MNASIEAVANEVNKSMDGQVGTHKERPPAAPAARQRETVTSTDAPDHGPAELSRHKLKAIGIGTDWRSTKASWPIRLGPYLFC